MQIITLGTGATVARRIEADLCKLLLDAFGTC